MKRELSTQRNVRSVLSLVAKTSKRMLAHPLLRKMGLAGFLFFLVKGLLWLLVPYLIATGLFGA